LLLTLKSKHNLIEKDLKYHQEHQPLFFQKEEFIKYSNDNTLKFDQEFASGNVCIHFNISRHKAISVIKGPFGSINYSNADQRHLSHFISYFINELRQKKIKQVIIKSYPRCYEEEKYLIINNTYQKQGFEVAYIDKTQYFNTSEDFKTYLKPDEKRYLNYAQKNQFLFKQLNVGLLPDSYRLIKSSREAKEYPVTMSLKDLEDTFHKFPENYMLFGVYDKNRLIATAVCVKVNSHILYTFYIGDDLEYRKHSPVVFLIANLHYWSSENAYKILDLGISTEKGKINEGLYKFKARLGTMISDKPVYSLDL